MHRIHIGEDARGHVVHVGDAVLETGQHESHDGEENGEQLAGGVLGRVRQVHRDAHHEVAEDAQHKRVYPRKAVLRGRHLRRVHRQVSPADVQLAEERHERCQNHRPRQVAEKDDAPVAQQKLPRNFAGHGRRHHERVAGEELRAQKNDHHKADGKDEARHEAHHAGIFQSMGGRRGRDRAQADKAFRVHVFGSVKPKVRFFRRT